MDAGAGVAPAKHAYETCWSAGSPCLLDWPWSACGDTTYPPNLWRGDPLSRRAWRMRSMKWGCGVTVMLRDGSEERRGYSPDRLFSDLPPRSSLENGTAGGYRAHIFGLWRPVHCLSATAVFGKSAFYHPRAQRRPHHHTLSPESGHYLPPSVPLDGRSAPSEGRICQ